jgi:hypothetical protein
MLYSSSPQGDLSTYAPTAGPFASTAIDGLLNPVLGNKGIAAEAPDTMVNLLKAAGTGPLKATCALEGMDGKKWTWERCGKIMV